MARCFNYPVSIVKILLVPFQIQWNAVLEEQGSRGAGEQGSRGAGEQGSRGGAVVRALAYHQCVLGSILGPGVICGLSLLLVLVLAPSVFLRVLQFSSLLKNQHF